MKKFPEIHGTTVIALKHENGAVMAGDGQVTLDHVQIKSSARKVRKLYHDSVLAGFAGATADAFTLFERFEQKLEAFGGNLVRSAVELAKDWRTDKVLRRLEALLIVTDGDRLLLLTGGGDVIEPDDDVIAIGSGGPYALAAARALLRHTSLSPREVVEEAMRISAELCIYTNENIIIEEIKKKGGSR